MKKNLKFLMIGLFFVAGFSAVLVGQNMFKGPGKFDNRDDKMQMMMDRGNPGDFGGKFGNMEVAKETPDYSLQETNGKISEDLYENFKAALTVNLTFNGTDFTASGDTKDISITKESKPEGITIEYKGKEKVKYQLSGNLTGTLLVKNKNADCALVMNNLAINSTVSGPAIRTTSETARTFIVIPAGTNNVITDNRTKSSQLDDDKKGSIYAKGAVIITGESTKAAGGKLTVKNQGYKHAVYSKDYIRVVNVDLSVISEGRDCLRALNAVIIDSGNINLIGNGKVEDEESAGIKVEGEDADEDDLTVTYNKGTGFIIINDGNITINTVGKAITAHWKYDETMIGNADYTEKDCNKSLLYKGNFIGDSVSVPNPFVTINGGTIDIKTTVVPTDYNSPEGIEAKNNLLIKNGKITVETTDDCINAGGGIKIDGGYISVLSTLNDAIDANGLRGIEITGGTVIAVATSSGAECAFDCDNNPFVITGGIVAGIGGSNYSRPTESAAKQNVLVLSATEAPAGSILAIIDSKKKPVFAYNVPAAAKQGFQCMILSVPELVSSDKNYTIVNDVKSVKGTEIENTGIYKDIKSISGGKNGTTFTISNTVTSVGNVNNGFGGRGGFGNFNGRGRLEDGNRPDFGEEPPEGFDRNNFKGNRR